MDVQNSAHWRDSEHEELYLCSICDQPFPLETLEPLPFITAIPGTATRVIHKWWLCPHCRVDAARTMRRDEELPELWFGGR